MQFIPERKGILKLKGVFQELTDASNQPAVHNSA